MSHIMWVSVSLIGHVAVFGVILFITSEILKKVTDTFFAPEEE